MRNLTLCERRSMMLLRRRPAGPNTGQQISQNSSIIGRSNGGNGYGATLDSRCVVAKSGEKPQVRIGVLTLRLGDETDLLEGPAYIQINELIQQGIFDFKK